MVNTIDMVITSTSMSMLDEGLWCTNAALLPNDGHQSQQQSKQMPKNSHEHAYKIDQSGSSIAYPVNCASCGQQHRQTQWWKTETAPL